MKAWLRVALLAAALLAAPLVAAGEPGAPHGDEAVTLFPDHPDREEVFYFCTACHSSRLVSNQAMSRERWDQTLTWMTERHGMPPLQGEDRDRYLTYLTRAFGPDAATTVPRAPFLTAPTRPNPFAPQ